MRKRVLSASLALSILLSGFITTSADSAQAETRECAFALEALSALKAKVNGDLLEGVRDERGAYLLLKNDYGFLGSLELSDAVQLYLTTELGGKSTPESKDYVTRAEKSLTLANQSESLALKVIPLMKVVSPLHSANSEIVVSAVNGFTEALQRLSAEKQAVILRVLDTQLRWELIKLAEAYISRAIQYSPKPQGSVKFNSFMAVLNSAMAIIFFELDHLNQMSSQHSSLITEFGAMSGAFALFSSYQVGKDLYQNWNSKNKNEKRVEKLVNLASLVKQDWMQVFEGLNYAALDSVMKPKEAILHRVSMPLLQFIEIASEGCSAKTLCQRNPLQLVYLGDNEMGNVRRALGTLQSNLKNFELSIDEVAFIKTAIFARKLDAIQLGRLSAIINSLETQLNYNRRIRAKLGGLLVDLRVARGQLLNLASELAKMDPSNLSESEKEGLRLIQTKVAVLNEEKVFFATAGELNKKFDLLAQLKDLLAAVRSATLKGELASHDGLSARDHHFQVILTSLKAP